MENKENLDKLDSFVYKLLESEDYVDLFNKYEISTNEDIVRYIETYNILTQEELVDKLNYIFNVEEFKVLKKVNRVEDLRGLEHRYGIIINRINSMSITIFYNGFRKLPFEEISMELSDYSNINFCPTTPLSIDKALGKKVDVNKLNYDFYVASIMLDCIRMQGSDVHIVVIHENKKPVYKVAFRLDVGYVYQDKYDMNAEMNRNLIFKLAARQTTGNEEDINIGGLTADVPDLLDNENYTLRIGANKSLGGYNCVSRIQKRKTVSLKIEELGFDEGAQQQLNYLSNFHKGLTLITGPVRSGKNTTIFALVNNMLDRPIRITEYSSPVELLMPIIQIDYGGSTKALADYIRLAKKQDTDLAIINEIPDKSIVFGIQDLVNSSIGVITTTHLDRIWNLPYKLKEYFGETYKDMISQINGVVNQKMFIKQCPKCGERILINKLPDEIEEFLQKHGVQSVVVSRGCSECVNGLTIGGMQPFVEILVFDRDIKRALLRCEKPHEMEEIIYDYMMESGASLDHKIAQAVSKGVLHYRSIYEVM